MSTPELERLFRDLHRTPAFTRFDRDRAGFLANYGLEPHEIRAVIDNDYGTLYGLGVHPMAVLFFSQDNHAPMASYLAAIGAKDQRVHEVGELFSEASQRTERNDS